MTKIQRKIEKRKEAILKYRRDFPDVSQVKLARIFHVNQATISRVLAGVADGNKREK